MAIDKDYVESTRIWLKTIDSAIAKTNTIIKAARADNKHNDNIIKYESEYLTLSIKRRKDAEKELREYLKSNK
jgi:hypothetical protein